MARGRTKQDDPKNDNGATLGFEAQMFLPADTPPKHIARGLIFLKSLFHAFEATQCVWLAKMHLAIRGIDAPRNHRGTFDLSPIGLPSFVLANGSISSSSGPSGKRAIRKASIEADLLGCIAVLQGQLFYSMQIPICLWVLVKKVV